MRKFQYNKTELLALDRELKVRINALPILESKEAALRAQVRRVKARLEALRQDCEAAFRRLDEMTRLWCEFPPIVTVKDVRWRKKNIAGVKVDVVDGIEFDVVRFSLFSNPAWFYAGVEIVKDLLIKKINLKAEAEVLVFIEYARRKTTQKVNLYKKVHIPAYQDAIQRIKRFLEDEETISKSSQKILKKRFTVSLEVAV